MQYTHRDRVRSPHPAGDSAKPHLRVDFDRRLKLEFHGSKITSDAGLLAYRELDEVLGLTDLGGATLLDLRRGKNTRHLLTGLLRQSVYGRLAGYEDVNDAERLSRDPAMRAIVDRKGLDRHAASTSQMGRFETEWLATDENLAALSDLSGVWIDRVHDRKPPKTIILDMDSSESPTHGDQEGSAYNGHFGCTCYHPLFCFNQFGDLERSLLRPGNVHSAEDWRLVLEPAVERYRIRDLRRYFRADAAFAKPEIYEFLEAEGYAYAIRLPTNAILQEKISRLLTRPIGRPPNYVRVFHASFSYQAATGSKPRRVVAKVEWHPGELYPKVGFIVTNLSRPAPRVTKFYNGRGTGEQWIKEGKNAINWTRLSCHCFRNNEVRLQLHALAYNLGNFLRTLALPEAIEHWSLTTLRETLIKIGAKIVRHSRSVTFQLSEVAIPRDLFAEILSLIGQLRPAPLPP
jgi:Transposase DDE domain group 1